MTRSELERRYIANKIGLDTLSKDIASVNKAIDKASTGWQTQETMKNTLSSVRSMYDRLGKYEEYAKQYGNGNLPDLTELRKAYEDAIDNWEDLSADYDKYKDAKTYTNEKTKLSELYSMTSKDIKPYLKNKKNPVAYTTSDGYNIKWEDLYNDAYRYEYEQDIDKSIDIKKKGKYKKKDAKLSNTWNGYAVIGDEDAFLYNYINGDKEARNYGSLINVHMSGTWDGIKDKFYTEDEKMRFNAIWETQGPEKALEYASLVDEELRERRIKYEHERNSEMAKESPFGASFVSVIDNIGNNALALPFMAMDYAEDGSIDSNSSLYTGRRRVQTQRSTIETDVIDSGIGKFFYRHGMNIADNLATRAVSLGTGSNIASTFLMGSGAAVDTALDAKERGLSDEQAIGLGVVAGAAEGFFESKGFESWIDSKTLSQSAWKYFTNNLKTELIGETLTEATNDIADYFIAQDLSKLNTEYQSHLASGLSNKEAFLKVVGGVASRYADVAAGTILSTGVMSGPGAVGGGIRNHYQNKTIGQNIRDNNRISDVFDMASNPEMASAYESYTRYANMGVTTENISDAQLGSLWQNARADKENIAHNKKSTGNQILFAKDDYAKLGDMASPNLERAITNAMNEKSKQNKKNESADSLIEKALESTEGTEAHKLATELKEKIDSGKKLSKDEKSKLTQAIKDETLESVTERLTELGEDENASEVADIIARNISNEDITKEELKKVLDSKYGLQVLNENNEGVANYVKGMDAKESAIFLRHYDGETDLEEYANSFNLVAEYSKHPESFTVDKILENKGPLSTDAVKEIYAHMIKKSDEASAKTNAELMARVRSGVRGIIDESAINYGKEYVSGKVNWNNLDNRQKQAVIFAKGLYKALGSNLVLVGKNKKFNGMYDVGKDMTFIDVYAGKNINDWTGTDFIITTIAHELTHEMEVKSPKTFKMLADIILDGLEKSPDYKGKTRNDIIADEINRLKKKGRSHTEADAISEIVARACEDLLAGSKEAQAMFKSLSPAEQKTFVEKIQDLIQKVIDWIDEFLSSYKNQSNSAEAKALREDKERLKAMQILWDKMLRETQAYNKATMEKSTTDESTTNDGSSSEGGMKFSERPFAEQVDEVLARTFDRTTDVYVGKLPQILQDVGLDENLPMLALASHIRKAHKPKNTKKHQHGLTKGQIKSIPNKIANPVMIMDSLDDAKNSIVVVTDMLDVDKSPIVVSIKADGKGRYNSVEVDSNFLTGYYGRDGFTNFIKNNVDKDTFLYINKEKAITLETESSTSWLEQLKGYDFNVIIRKTRANVKGNIFDGDVKYKLREEAISEIEQAITDKTYDKEIKLTDNSPAILVSQKGVKNLPMMMVASHLRENILTEKEAKILGLKVNSGINYHGLGKSLFMKVIDGLDNVTEAYRGTKNAEDSSRRENYFLLISQYKDSDGNTINVPVYVNEKGRYNRIFIDTNKIATVFGRGELQKYLKKQIANGNLVRIKNRSTQASESQSPIDSDYSKNASKDSIPNPTEKVNTKFSDRDTTGRGLSPEQVEYFKDIDNLNPTKNEDMRYQERESQESAPRRFDEHSVQTALWEAFDHNDKGFDNLIKVSKMPEYFVNLLGIDGDFYIYRDHAYENMVSKEVAEANGRPTRRHGKDINFHNIGIETMTEAMLSMEHPSVTICDKMADGNPALLMVLPVYDKDGDPLYGVASFYSNRSINGSFATKPHILLTIYKREYFEENSKGRQGLVDIINEAIEDGRIVDFDRKKIRDDLPVIAQHTRLGNITEKSLNANLSQFQKEVNSFREKNKINYSDRQEDIYDLMGERDAWVERSNMLSADFERLKERWSLDKGISFRKSQIGSVARYILNQSGSNMDSAKLEKRLTDAYTYIADAMGKDEKLTWEDVSDVFYNIANDLIKDTEVSQSDYSKLILRELRKTRVSLTQSQKEELRKRFGNDWITQFMGKVTVANNGISLEEQWKSWVKKYPTLFSADTKATDMPIELYNAVGNLNEAGRIISEYETLERVTALAEEIYNKLWTITPIKTTTEKDVQKIKKLNLEHRREMDKAKLINKTVSKADKSRVINLANEIRERRDRDVARAKELGRKRLDKFKENAERKTRIQSITANALTLKKWIEKNDKHYHVHEAMKGPVIKLLQAIDFSSKRKLGGGMPTQRDISFSEAFSEIKTMFENAKNMEVGLEDLYEHNVAEGVNLLAEGAYSLVGDNHYVLNAMTTEQLKHFDRLVNHFKKVVSQLNKFHVTQHNAGIEDLGVKTAEEVESAKKVYQDNKKHFDKLKTKLYWNQINPYYAFKNLGEHAMKIFNAFMDGQDKVALLAKEVIDFAESVYNSKEYEEWDKKFFDFEINQPDGSVAKFTMNVPQIMSLYCVSKQEDAKKHILHGNQEGKNGNEGKGRGITLVETDRTEAVRKNILLTEADLNGIIAKLNEAGRAKEVADKLQNYMATKGAELGNEISMARWGIKSFGIENYFPIKVSDGGKPTKELGGKANPLISLLNMSFTHSRNHYASQSIEIGNVFDVFANHMSAMIQYNAMALPVLDMYKWMNTQVVDDHGNEISLKTSIQDTFGEHAWKYFDTFLQDVNGSTNGDTRDNLGVKFFKNAKVAKVAANLRVMLLQFTSYIRAGAVMDNKYLLRALAHKPKIAMSTEHCGMVLWKSLGYYETDITRPLTDKIKHVEKARDRIIKYSLKPAEIADKITLGYLWNACELEIRDTRKDLKVGSDEFYNEIGLRLREVIYRTQVVDSQLTRSQMMRSKGGWDKVLTTFASEATLSLNIVSDLFVSYELDSRRMGKEAAKKKHGKYMRKAITAYVVTNVVTAMLATMFDAFRDYDEEDKDEEYIFKLMLENFLTNSSLINKIPYLNLVVSTLSGFTPSRVETDWMKYSAEAIKEILKLMEGEGSVEKVCEDILRAFSDATGVAGYNLYRDVRAFVELFN